MKTKQYIRLFTAALSIIPILCSCDSQEQPGDPNKPDNTVPEGMVEIQPVLPGCYYAIPRDPSNPGSGASRAYDTREETESKLEHNPVYRLPMWSTVWLIAKHETASGEVSYVRKSYVVYNPTDDTKMSYLLPCTVNDAGEFLTIEGSPLYLKKGETYKFYVVSPARKIGMMPNDKYGFKVKNGEYFYSSDVRYSYTSPTDITVTGNNTGGGGTSTGTNPEDVQLVELSPIINQSALLKFKILPGYGVHDLGIQPSGVHISGLQNDSPTDDTYGDADGIYWHIPLTRDDEPIILQHANKDGAYICYDYTIDPDDKSVNIEVPILPMYCISKPVIVILRLKVNGVPTSFEIMLNEKDFKAGYSYGYRGTVDTTPGIDVITWQYVGWIEEIPLPEGGGGN